jgi:hypothetical protein
LYYDILTFWSKCNLVKARLVSCFDPSLLFENYKKEYISFLVAHTANITTFFLGIARL